MTNAPAKILTLFGTRPEVIKLAPVIRALESMPDSFETVNVSSSQHTDLLHPLIRAFDLRLDHDLSVMRPGQALSGLCARVLAALDPVLESEKPAVVLVQGDTTTALAGALGAFHRGVRVGHVEAGLRSGDRLSPFPEEMNRQLISRVADFHFAATQRNRDALLREGVPSGRVFLTGNPVVDALREMAAAELSPATADVLAKTEPYRRVLLTTHRRESFGEKMAGNLRALERFVRSHPEVALIFPVHPNPSVTGPAREILGGRDRIHLVAPMEYGQFLAVMKRAWLIVSDSGGVQEEAPSLGKPLLVLRENTERPEAVESGWAKLGGSPELLSELLERACEPRGWADAVRVAANPFGDGRAAANIAAAIASSLGLDRPAGAKRPAVQREAALS